MNRLHRAAWIVGSLLCTAAPFHCHAGGAPLATDDTDVLDAADCEWEGGYTRQKAHRSPAENGWETELSCGIGLRTQLALAYGEARAADRTSRNVTLLGKTRLVERQDDRIGLSVAWTIGGVRNHDESFKHDFSQLYLVASQEVVKNLTWHANLGWLHDQIEHRDHATWNLAGEYALGGGVDAVAEFYGESHIKPWWGVGARWQATEALSLNAGFSLQTENPRIRQWSVGFKYAF